MSNSKQRIEDLAASLAPQFEQISHTIFSTPELGLQEYRSSRYLAELMQSYGFSVKFPYCGIPQHSAPNTARRKGLASHS